MEKEKLYSVKEIGRLTGLTRKQLFDYQESIPPAATENKANYKLYDKKGLEKLCLASMFSELGAKPKQINSIFKEEKIDREGTMNLLIAEAKRRISVLEDIVLVGETLKYIDYEDLSHNPLSIINIHELAEKIRDYNQKIDYSLFEEKDDKALYAILSGVINKNGKVKQDQLANVVNQLKEYYESRGLEGTRGTVGFAYTLLGNNDISKTVEELLGDGKSRLLGKAIIEYMVEPLEEPFYETIEKFNGLKNKNYQDKMVKNAIDELVQLFHHYLGYDTYTSVYAEIETYFTSLDSHGEMQNRDAVEYILNALAYYMGREKVEKDGRILTGYKELDKITRGLGRGELMLIGGAYSMGKSTLAFNLIKNISYKQAGVSSYISIVETDEEIRDKAGKYYNEKTLKLRKETEKKLLKRIKTIAEADRVSGKKGVSNVHTIENVEKSFFIEYVMGIIEKEHPDILIIDNVRRIKGYDPVDISTRLKEIAIKYNISIVLTMNLKNSRWEDGKATPCINDIDKGKALSKIIDSSIFVFREEYYTRRDMNCMELLLSNKNDYTKTEKYDVFFDYKTGLLMDFN